VSAILIGNGSETLLCAQRPSESRYHVETSHRGLYPVRGISSRGSVRRRIHSGLVPVCDALGEQWSSACFSEYLFVPMERTNGRYPPDLINGAQGSKRMATLRAKASRHGISALLWLAFVAGVSVAPQEVAQAAFPGINGRIVFVGQESGDYDIYSVNVDGTNLVNLTNNTGHADLFPQWSPDGQRIAYETHHEGFGNYQIAVMDADGSNKTMLGSSAARMPAWSPDGTKIAYWK
jgi:hypothetical protein